MSLGAAILLVGGALLCAGEFEASVQAGGGRLGRLVALGPAGLLGLALIAGGAAITIKGAYRALTGKGPDAR